MVSSDAAGWQGCGGGPAEAGLCLGRDSPQPDEPHAEGPGACAAAAARDPVHAGTCLPPHCHDLVHSWQLCRLHCHSAGAPSSPHCIVSAAACYPGAWQTSISRVGKPLARWWPLSLYIHSPPGLCLGAQLPPLPPFKCALPPSLHCAPSCLSC